MDEQTYVITFDDASAAEANRYAGELRQALLDASPEVVVHRQRDDPGAQDFGATLLFLLGTPAAGAIVKAIGDWLALRHRASLTIKRADGEIVVRNITSARAAELAPLLLNQQEPSGMKVPAPSPETTLLILLGASAWPLSPEFQSSQAFANAARRVKAYFLNPRPFGLPAENLLDLFDTDDSADELDMAIGQFLEQRLAAMRAAGTAGRDLLLYFIGHGGFVGHDSDFYLALAPRGPLTASATPVDRIDLVLLLNKVSAKAAELIGNDPGDLTDSGLWPSDHAGVVATVRI